VLEYVANVAVDLCVEPEANGEALLEALEPWFEGDCAFDVASASSLLHAVVKALHAPPPPPPSPLPSPPAELAEAPCEPACEPPACTPRDADAFWLPDELLEDPAALWGECAPEEEPEAEEASFWWSEEAEPLAEEGAEAWRAADAQVAALRELFPKIPERDVCAALLAAGGDADAASALLLQLPPPPPPPPPSLDDAELFPSLGGGGGGGGGARAAASGRAVGGFAAALRARSAEAPPAAEPPRHGVARGARPSTLPAPAPAPAAASPAARWVETGASVSALYAQLRGEARDHVRLRNACFQNATLAYLSGDGAAAKRLAAEGRRHAAAMFAAHRCAAEATFESRNGGGAEEGKVPLLDLHGLHAAEAVGVLRARLAALRAQRGPGSVVHVLVGTGHHTVGEKTAARLPVAVMALVRDELRLRSRQRTAGLLEVTL